MVQGFFVYGTLKAGCRNERVVSALRTSVKEARVAGMELYDVGHFPGMIESGISTSYVYGEFHTFADADMDAVTKRLDMLEGYREGRDPKSNLYNRITVMVELAPTGREVEAYAYLFSDAKRLRDRCEMCEDGVWIENGRKPSVVSNVDPTQENAVR